ncbi:MAG: general secretion pathway protein GspB [Desulfuromonadaceae bacterium]|nr:general secretion pathway protein GspB [Desulfuromonadaceae bacterium]
MSSILKALKKIEQERAGQRDGVVNITFDVIKGGDQPRRHEPPLVLVLLVVIVLLVGATFFWWRSDKEADSLKMTASPEVLREVVLTVDRPQAASSPPAKQGTPTASTVVTAPAPVIPGEPLITTAKDVATDVSGAPVAPVSARFQLSAIVYDAVPENRLAVINDLPVMEGTMIADALVVEITADLVVVEIAGEFVEIRLAN